MTTSPAASGPDRTTAVVVLCVMCHTALTGSRVAVSLTALSLGLSPLHVGTLLAVFSLLPALGGVAMGRWVDRHGARTPVLAGTAAMVAGTAMAGVHLAPVTLWLAAALVGGGFSTALVALQSLLGRTTAPDGQRSGVSAFALGTALSAILGPLVAGQALAWLGGRAAFGVLAAIALAACLAVARCGRAWHAPTGAAARPRGGGGTRQLFTDHPALRQVLVADLLIAVAWQANYFIVPIHGTREGWSAAAMGNLLATFGLAVLLVRALPDRWLGRLGGWGAIRLALGCSAACYLLLPFVHQLPVAYAVEFLLGLGLGGALPGVLALLHAACPGGREGEVLGLRVVALNVHAILLPVALGGLGVLVGLSPVMWALGAGLGAAAGWRRGLGGERLRRRPPA